MAGTQRLDLVPGARPAACLVAGLLAALVMLAVPAISSARLIEAPRDGATVKGPTKVVATVGRGSVYARLNGERVKRHFLRTGPKQRAVRVGAAEGLKPGRNLLRVRRETPRGETTRSRVVFRVRARGKIAGITARGDHVAGAPLKLRAHGSPKLTWCLTHAPRQSALEPTSCPSARKRNTVRLGDAQTRNAKAIGFDDLDARRTSFTPDVPGVYRVGLASGSGPGGTNDVYTVTAGESTPLVPFDVPLLNDDGFGGIKVAGSFYPPPEATDDEGQLQTLVLQRQTLTQQSNTTYSCTGGPTSCDAQIAAEVSGDLAKLDDSSLVLVSSLLFAFNENTFGTQTFQALEKIGVDQSVPFPAPVPGSDPPSTAIFAAVGIPNLKPGEARVFRDSVSGGSELPHLTGVLSRVDDAGDYAPVPTDYIPLTVRSPETTTENTMEIADNPVTGVLPSGAAGGFQIAVVDGVSGDQLVNEVAVTNPASSSTLKAALASADQATSSGDPAVLLVASLGSPADQAPQIAGDWTALANFVQQHGGTVHAVVSMKPGDTYAMAGQTNSGAANGVEVGPMVAMPGEKPTGALVGRLTRDDDWRLTPSVADVTDPAIAPMQTLYQQPTPWPQFDAGAMCYIGNAPGVALGDDVRQAYWVQPYGPDSGYWEGKSTAIANLDYPANGDPGPECAEYPPFSSDDFKGLQTELTDPTEGEIHWLIQAHAYLGNLKAPFGQQSGSSAWATVQTIADEVASNVTAPNNPISESWETIVGDLLAISAVFEPEDSIVLSAMSASFEAAADLGTVNQSGTSAGEDNFQTTADNFGAALLGRLNAIEDSYDQMLDIVAADYGKLQTFGTLGGCEPASTTPPCPVDWQWTQAMEGAAKGGLELWARRQTWQALLPAKIGASAWFGWYPPGSKGTDAGAYYCDTSRIHGYNYYPYAGMPAAGQAVLSSIMLPDGAHHDLWAIASWDVDLNDAHRATLPTASLVNPLFAPANQPDPGGNPVLAGLGFVPAHFLWQAYPKPLDVYHLTGDPCVFKD